MTETKHTPGPWEAQIGHSDWGLPCSHVIVREGETGNDYDTWIAEVPSVTPYCMGASRRDKERSASQLANARLIAAAPELLDALKSLIGAPGHDGRLWSARMKSALAAIAKAEGRYRQHQEPRDDR